MTKAKQTGSGLVTVDVGAMRRRAAELRLEADRLDQAAEFIEAHKGGSGTVTFDAPSSNQPTHTYTSGLTDAVRSSVSRIAKDEFTVRDVENYLKFQGATLPKAKPRDRLAMVLKSLREKGEIELTHEGSGRDPHRYKVKK